MFYIGSCRYMYGYDWDYFPARLHTTREIIFFLENINNIKKIINDNPSVLTNFIFGDIYHNGVIKDSQKFMNQGINKNIKKIIIEISSRKVIYYNNIPLNNFYFYYHKQFNLVKKYNLIEKKLTDEEIEYDIIRIIQLCKTVFNENIKIHIIPHLNLKTKLHNNYISDRNCFVNLLEYLANKYQIKIHNIGKYIENNNNESFLEDYMSDSTHYSYGYDKIKEFLISEIIDN